MLLLKRTRPLLRYLTRQTVHGLCSPGGRVGLSSVRDVKAASGSNGGKKWEVGGQPHCSASRPWRVRRSEIRIAELSSAHEDTATAWRPSRQHRNRCQLAPPLKPLPMLRRHALPFGAQERTDRRFLWRGALRALVC